MKTIIIILAINFTLLSSAQALEKVNFPSKPGPHSPFKIKKAAAKGIQLAPKTSVQLTGYLGLPSVTAVAPAVILLHSGNGLQDYHKQWAQQLQQWGYVSLLIYSYAGVGEEVDASINLSGDVISNAYGASDYLKSLPYVNPERIALMGWSAGGNSVFNLTAQGPPPGRKTTEQFDAAVIFYPQCNPKGAEFRAPMLLLLGDNDGLLQKGDCQLFKQASEQKNAQQQIELQVYSGATHFYDDPKYPSASSAEKSAYYYANTAHQDSLLRVKAFLAKYL
ncbi:MAG: dienelactone hydrolase family protein [Pseudomonadales bacterium]|nr:dienelactone hydrolase family protein [Pseudomonadales bacterium]NRA18457.1 dienelactone hydrolase family protein [Oceanospirillaceae bacterium]